MAYPALKRWAIFFRPAERDSVVGSDDDNDDNKGG